MSYRYIRGWNGLKGVIWEFLYSGGPWEFSNLVYQVQSQTGFNKDLDYEYYVRKYVEMWEEKEGMRCLVEEPPTQVEANHFPFCPNCGIICTNCC